MLMSVLPTDSLGSSLPYTARSASAIFALPGANVMASCDFDLGAIRDQRRGGVVDREEDLLRPAIAIAHVVGVDRATFPARPPVAGALAGRTEIALLARLEHVVVAA